MKRTQDRPPERIAVFCPNLIGDTVMATPALRIAKGVSGGPNLDRDQATRGADARRGSVVR